MIPKLIIDFTSKCMYILLQAVLCIFLFIQANTAIGYILYITFFVYIYDCPLGTKIVLICFFVNINYIYTDRHLPTTKLCAGVSFLYCVYTYLFKLDIRYILLSHFGPTDLSNTPKKIFIYLIYY